MAGKKENRSSKTDHVLHLLSSMIPEQEEDSAQEKPTFQESSSASQESTPVLPESTSAPAAPASYPPEMPQHLAAPILEVAHNNHEALAESIRQALENDLEKELAHPEEPATPSPAPVLSSKNTGLPVKEKKQKTVPAPAPEIYAESAPQSSATETDSLSSNIRELPDGSVWIDVMPILVEEQLDHYLKLFGLCTCDHCRADVQALALNGLPTKYVVLEKEKANSMLGFYRYRFGTSVNIELTKACEIVKEHPHHT